MNVFIRGWLCLWIGLISLLTFNYFCFNLYGKLRGKEVSPREYTLRVTPCSLDEAFYTLFLLEMNKSESKWAVCLWRKSELMMETLVEQFICDVSVKWFLCENALINWLVFRKETSYSTQKKWKKKKRKRSFVYINILECFYFKDQIDYAWQCYFVRLLVTNVCLTWTTKRRKGVIICSSVLLYSDQVTIFIFFFFHSFDTVKILQSWWIYLDKLFSFRHPAAPMEILHRCIDQHLHHAEGFRERKEKNSIEGKAP